MTNPTPVKDETQRQIVILVFSTIGTLVAAYIIYEFAKPDAFKSLKMRVALWAKRFSQSQVDWWQSRADDAATIYNRERP